jgi:hypothetical protein
LLAADRDRREAKTTGDGAGHPTSPSYRIDTKLAAGIGAPAVRHAGRRESAQVRGGAERKGAQLGLGRA